MNYTFDVEIAKEYGVNGAIMIENLAFWTLKNKANNKHFYDGHYWTYNSVEAFTELFPFWSYDQIRGILKKLEEKGAIISGNYNTSPYDRTKWYTIAPNLLSIWGKSQMKDKKIPNENGENPTPIPDNKPDNKPNNKQKNIPLKISFAEFVKLTESEYQKLIDQYGEVFTKACIEKLDNYKGASGKKYTSDYRAILTWVADDISKKINPSKKIAKPPEIIYGDYDEAIRKIQEEHKKKPKAQIEIVEIDM